MFSEEVINKIMRNFPNFELCYEKITHKKVLDSGAILAIPEGIKGFAWFTSYKNDCVCFLLNINENNQITDIKQLTTNFTDNLSLGLGTIFYGTSIKNKPNLFCVEDMYYYAGKFYNNYSYNSKLEKIKDIFKNEILQIALFDKYTIFGIPLILNDLQLLVKHIQYLPYNVSDIKFRFFENEKSKKILYMKYFKPGSQKKEIHLQKRAIFKIIPDIDPDIYHLL